jgi:hypothetical protein
MAQKLRPQAETLSGSPQPNFVNYAPKSIIAKRAPTSGDTGYDLGQQWVDKINGNVYVLSSVAAGAADWELLGGSSSSLSTLTADSGGALSPTGGNINILGTASQITTTGSGSTITLSIPNAAIVPGSMVVTTTLSSAGATTLATTGASVNTFGNATGATSVTITSGTGGIALASTGTGDITLDSDDTLLIDADGVLELNSSAGAISIGNDADSQNINIGTAGTRTVSVGSAAATLAVLGAVDINVSGAANTNIGTGLGSTGIVTIGNTTGTTLVVGDITVVGGGEVRGNLTLQQNAAQLRIKGGAVTDFIGQATLVLGTVTVSNTNIAAADEIFVTRSSINGASALGVFEATISAGVSFTINARKTSDATVETNDISVVDYVIIRRTA